MECIVCGNPMEEGFVVGKVFASQGEGICIFPLKKDQPKKESTHVCSKRCCIKWIDTEIDIWAEEGGGL